MAYYGYPQINPALQNWYGQFYQPVQPPMQNPVPQAMPKTMPQAMPQQVQAQMSGANQPQQAPAGPAPVQGGFVRVQSEQEARSYPVAPGNSITFIDESRPYCYTKSVDMSQLDRPKFDRYRLVKEEDAPAPSAPSAADGPVRLENGPQTHEGPGVGKLSDYALKTDLGPLWAEIEALKRRIETAKAKPAKKEGVRDDGEPSD